MKKIKITYWDRQRLGNYQIRVNRLSDLEFFIEEYIYGFLLFLGGEIRDVTKLSDKENGRRWYVDDVHIDFLRNDDRIDLIPAFKWNENQVLINY